MAKARRSFTDAQKQEVIEYAAAHGDLATMEKFQLVRSVLARWKRAAKPAPTGRKRKWTPEKIAEVLEYAKTHKNRETVAHFKISSGQIHLWKSGKTQAELYGSRKKKANGEATNGLGTLPERDALMWLQRWRDAYFDRVKAETPLAADVLAALRGGK